MGDPGVDPAERGRLAWRCRRGMKELDLLLLAYVDCVWPRATMRQRAGFEQILGLPDPQLAAFLLGHESCTDPVVAEVVATLRGLDVRSVLTHTPRQAP